MNFGVASIFVYVNNVSVNICIWLFMRAHFYFFPKYTQELEFLDVVLTL